MKPGMIENLLVVFLQRDLQSKSHNNNILRRWGEFVYVRVTVGESGVLERRLMTERITDLWILESTEVKFWISTLQKSNNLLIELSEVCWFNQNFYYFCWIFKTVPDIMVFFSRNHESGQIGCVDSEKHDREKRPNTGHEPAKFRKVWWDLSRSWGLFRFSPGRQAPGTVHLK